MKKYILLTGKAWHNQLFDSLSTRPNEKWIRISIRDEFTMTRLKEIGAETIFIPHWSYIIPAEFFNSYECVVFHMTDLPYGRGGSPLQNLIIRGHKDTKITAIRVSEGIDTGDVYLKENLLLNGTAREIFFRSASIIEKMIHKIIVNQIKPKPQEGEVTIFKRRKPDDGDLTQLKELTEIYDYIRMLDCDGYPKSFIHTEEFSFEFTNASLKPNEEVIANVRITKK